MRTERAENLIARLCKVHEIKKEQLERLKDITLNCTSDAGIDIDLELYDNSICRFIVNGTRSKMTITYNALTWELTRKPRNAKPWETAHIHANAYDILRKI